MFLLRCKIQINGKLYSMYTNDLCKKTFFIFYFQILDKSSVIPTTRSFNKLCYIRYSWTRFFSFYKFNATHLFVRNALNEYRSVYTYRIASRSRLFFWWKIFYGKQLWNLSLIAFCKYIYRSWKCCLHP